MVELFFCPISCVWMRFQVALVLPVRSVGRQSVWLPMWSRQRATLRLWRLDLVMLRLARHCLILQHQQMNSWVIIIIIACA